MFYGNCITPPFEEVFIFVMSIKQIDSDEKDAGKGSAAG
jgi:hypothetical protein